ncbi:MAG: tRNA lysidine(34) synthetase TilS [Magnetospirillum sp.]|nr:tRNA lysidine(34) synthetase TilS [Magnetospirillum sp.]
MTAPPLTAEEFSTLMARLGPFEARPVVAVAVSGGADSLALALLAGEWARHRGGEAVALTVDHGLRPESAAEARRVAGWLAEAGLPHHLLRWDGAKPARDLQAAARAARYRLLGDWCRDRGVLHLLLGHHRDDQAETLLLRLGRGSGVDGLAAMAAVQPTPWGRLLRPLLPLPRGRLETTLTARGQPWVEDPSNRNGAFARVRLRRLAGALAAEGMTAARLAATARRMGRARAALEQVTAAAAARAVEVHPGGFALVRPEVFREVAEDIGLRLLSRLLLAVGGGDYTPRLGRLERLYAQLAAGLPGARTLAGCRVAPWRGRLVVSREAARVAPPVALAPGTAVTWDGRFAVRVAASAPAGLRLGALGGWRHQSGGELPAAVRSVLPALYDDDGVSAVPHLSYNLGLVGRTLQSLVLAPAHPLTVAGHCLV